MADLQERVRSLEADNARLSYALHERSTEIGRMREELASHDRGASGEGLPARASESAALEGEPSSTLKQAKAMPAHIPARSPCTDFENNIFLASLRSLSDGPECCMLSTVLALPVAHTQQRRPSPPSLNHPIHSHKSKAYLPLVHPVSRCYS